jgi:hypothetical protein
MGGMGSATGPKGLAGAAISGTPAKHAMTSVLSLSKVVCGMRE